MQSVFIYEILLLIGFFGFAAMLILGFGHSAGGHGGHAQFGHGGHGGLHGGHHGFSVKTGHGHAGHGHNAGTQMKNLLAISPMDLFAFALGAGAVGILLQRTFKGSVLPWVALAGALVLNYAIIHPMFNMAMKFVSKPSEGLEGAISMTAEATTAFDADGKGVIKLSLDGQAVQLLALLDQGDIEDGLKVRKGDEVVILDVDPKRNTCRVTRTLSQ